VSHGSRRQGDAPLSLMEAAPGGINVLAHQACQSSATQVSVAGEIALAKKHRCWHLEVELEFTRVVSASGGF
jgi:hypothetical protein